MKRSKPEKGIRSRIDKFLNKRTPKPEQLSSLEEKAKRYIARVEEFRERGLSFKEARQKAYDEIFSNTRH